MKKIAYRTRTGLNQFRPAPMSEAAFTRRSDESKGFCLACGKTVEGVEPDARKYTCEFCKAPKVYGLEELLMMGLVKVSTHA